MEDNTAKEELEQQCKQLQEEELVLLRSMFSIPDELEFFISSPDDHQFEASSSQPDVPGNADFALKLNVSNHLVELTFHLPPAYPIFEHPQVFVRCNSLPNTLCLELNRLLREQLKNLGVGEPAVSQCVFYAKEYLLDEVKSKSSLDHLKHNDFPSPTTLKERSIHICRYWIYSHHIYNRTKRRNILSLCKKLNLTGFCLPGKPGVICIEGDVADCSAFWEKVKSWSWQKIIVKHVEYLKNLPEKCEKLAKFECFIEISMSMGEMKKMLEGKGCDKAFGWLFGLSN